MNHGFWEDRRVFLTGHTGFKGGWLAVWLAHMGAKVFGYALDPSTTPDFFTVAQVGPAIERSEIGDIRDAGRLSKAMQAANPEIVFHLAAQPLVRYSYTHPVETYATNVMGTVHLLEAVRSTPGVKAVVIVTTDKCYENREWVWPYRENDPLGGYDPYSSSKGCAELVTAAYRRSFLEPYGIHVASARAGNVIGGGDWSEDRLIPDFLRALDARKTLIIRSPGATRPWQHVLEPLQGYLMLAEKLHTDGVKFAEAWNFGPKEEDARTVQWIVGYLCSKASDSSWQADKSLQPHEANYLRLDSSKAGAMLGWHSRWDLDSALVHTLGWHTAWKNGANMTAKCIEQILEYENAGSPA
jgi:CDP-glucose 4,6-dehydratase